MRAVITRRAERQIRTATTWLDENRGEHASDVLHSDIARALRLLVRHPLVGASVKNARAKDARGIYLKGARYHLYYRVRGELIEVLAIRHSSRGRSPGI